MRLLPAAVAAVLIAALAAGCDRGDSSKPKISSAGSVKIVALSPDTATPLKIGDKVKIEIEVSYRLAAEAGTVSVVVQAGKAGLAQTRAAVKKGEGRATMSAEFVVPDTQAVQVFTPLQAQGQKATATVDVRTYKVVPK